MRIANVLTSIALTSAAALSATGAFAASDETFANGRSIYGVPANQSADASVLDVAKAKFANIQCGDIVTFRSGDKTFTWKFDVAGHRAVDLQKIAPAGFATQPFMVYVSRNDTERK